MDVSGMPRNYTVYVRADEIIVTPGGGGGGEQHAARDREYEQFMADVWVGVVLTLMVVSCVCCMCSFLLYHKFQQWKITAVDDQPRPYTIESGLDDLDLMTSLDGEPLPNYTLVSGLPTYDEALEQIRKARELRRASLRKMLEARKSLQDNTPLSLAEFLQVYKSQRIIVPPVAAPI